MSGMNLPWSGEIKKSSVVLGLGTLGTVLRSTYNDEEVAVKRIDLYRLDKTDFGVIAKLNHENILKIKAVEQDNDFMYIVLELCAGTLLDVCERQYQGPFLPSDEEVVHQIIKGLNYIHSMKFVHQSMKPSNVLISKTAPARIILSDFGLRSNHSFSINELQMSHNWVAPELQSRDFYSERRKGTFSSDIFSAGCVIFYYVTRGTHPFGDLIKVTNNIVHNKPTNISNFGKASGPAHEFLIDIARGMIAPDQDKRSPLNNILKEFELRQQPMTKSLINELL